VTVVELANGYFTRHYMCSRRMLLALPQPEEPDADGPVSFELEFATP